MNLGQFQKNGKFLMLALDHRGSFKKLINQGDPDSISDQQAISLKLEIIKSVEDQISGLLIDVDWGLPAFPQKSKPFLLPVEKSGYTQSSGERITELEKSVKELISLGASGIKLLLYFNPNLLSANKQIETARKVLRQSQEAGCPFFLEIVTYEPKGQKEDREKLVLDSLNILLENKITPSVYKLEYPGNLPACKKITQMLGRIPWILLTRGDSFEHFKIQLKDASAGGAVGFLAGRALWQEVCQMQGKEKDNFLKETLPHRFRVIAEVLIRA